jgi:glycosyltransferase involved in cell wall biosynthesis
MRKLRIIHVITRLDKGGSAENTLLTVLGNLEHGHSVALVCGVSNNPPSENEELAREKGANIHRLKNLVREISPVKDLAALATLYIFLKRHPCDVLHTHTSKAGIIARFAAMFAGVRCVIHTPHGHIFYHYFSPLKTMTLVAIERLATLRTTALITLTSAERQDYLDRRIGREDNTFPIFSGIDLRLYTDTGFVKSKLRRELGLPEERYIAGTVARLVSVKNHDLIISAASELSNSCPDIIFVFVGDGDLHDHLVERINGAGLTDRFVLLGWRNDVARLLHSFDLFIMCSHNEGMGRAFVEAQASGLPVIGSQVGGIPEVILEGKTGFIVSPDDAHALAERIKEMYTQRDNAQEISRRCREWVDPRFSRKRMVESIEALYQRYAVPAKSSPVNR